MLISYHCLASNGALGCMPTGGKVLGDVQVGGFPKDQASFARVSGYVEQFDIHSPLVGPSLPPAIRIVILWANAAALQI